MAGDRRRLHEHHLSAIREEPLEEDEAFDKTPLNSASAAAAPQMPPPPAAGWLDGGAERRGSAHTLSPSNSMRSSSQARNSLGLTDSFVMDGGEGALRHGLHLISMLSNDRPWLAIVTDRINLSN